MKNQASPNKKNNILFLLIDKQGDIGNAVISQLQKDKISFSGVFAAQKFSSTANEDILQCPFQAHMPIFPDGDYSHIVIVYNGEKEVLDSLSGFSKKAKVINGEFFIVVPIQLYTNDFQKKLQSVAQGAKIIIVGDIFGEHILQEGTTIANFLQYAKKEERIVVSGMGLNSTYPVYIDDVAEAITRTIFIKKEKKGIFFSFSKHPITELSLARVFQKVDPVLRIDFVGDQADEKNTNVMPADGVYLLDDSYKVDHAVKKIYEMIVIKDFIPQSDNPVKKAVGQRSARLYFFRLLIFALIFFIMPYVATILFMGLGAYDIVKAKNALMEGNLKKIKTHAAASDAFLSMAQKSFAVFSTMPFLQNEKLTSLVGENLAYEKTAASLFLKVPAIADSWSTKDGVSLSANLREVLANLQLTRTQQGSVSVSTFSTHALSSTANLLHDALGFSKPKKYLILLQNNMELRPGGGFIGSYAIAKVNKGDAQLSLHDVYNADGQLKGHVEPPFAIRRHLKSIHWYLRDSNFSANFPSNASASAFFLQQETGEIVDGVIAVDVSFVKMLVSVFGKIEVPDYKETITTDNFYTVVQNHAEKDFFPGSTQKKDFLQSLFFAIQTRLMQKDVPYQELYKVLLQGLAQKHVLVVSSDQSIQNVFTANSMSSSLYDGRVKKDSVVDYVGISEANVGVNKANVGISRKLSYDVEIDKNATLSSKLTITYKNEKSNNTYAADYKNYLRIIVPKNSVLKSVNINGEEQKIIPAITDPKVYEAKKFVAPKGLEVTVEEEVGKTLFGFLVTVPLGQESVIVVRYLLPRYLSTLPSAFTYDLRVFKQPGTDVYPFLFSVQYPKDYNIVKTSEGFNKEILLNSDMNMNVLFSSK